MGGNVDMTEGMFNLPGINAHIVKFVGGTTAVTKVHGPGMVVTYISTGVVDLNWAGNANNPGTFIGLAGAPSFQATTPGDVKSYAGVPGVYNTSTKKLRLSMYESGTLTDLDDLEWCTVVALFQVV